MFPWAAPLDPPGALSRRTNVDRNGYAEGDRRLKKSYKDHKRQRAPARAGAPDGGAALSLDLMSQSTFQMRAKEVILASEGEKGDDG